MNKRKQKQFMQLSANLTVEQMEKRLKEAASSMPAPLPPAHTPWSIPGGLVGSMSHSLAAVIFGSPPIAAGGLVGHTVTGVVMDDLDEPQVGDIATTCRPSQAVFLVKGFDARHGRVLVECLLSDSDLVAAYGTRSVYMAGRAGAFEEGTLRRLTKEEYERVEDLLPEYLADMPA